MREWENGRKSGDAQTPQSLASPLVEYLPERAHALLPCGLAAENPHGDRESDTTSRTEIGNLIPLPRLEIVNLIPVRIVFLSSIAGP